MVASLGGFELESSIVWVSAAGPGEDAGAAEDGAVGGGEESRVTDEG